MTKQAIVDWAMFGLANAFEGMKNGLGKVERSFQNIFFVEIIKNAHSKY